jgi:hypothetical protein
LAASGAPPDFCRAVETAIAAAKGQGPYGSYPAGPLSREDTPGPTHRVAAETRPVLGSRLATAFDHMHLLVFHPRDAAPAALQALLDAGWTTTDIGAAAGSLPVRSMWPRVLARCEYIARRENVIAVGNSGTGFCFGCPCRCRHHRQAPGAAALRRSCFRAAEPRWCLDDIRLAS